MTFLAVISPCLRLVEQASLFQIFPVDRMPELFISIATSTTGDTSLLGKLGPRGEFHINITPSLRKNTPPAVVK